MGFKAMVVGLGIVALGIGAAPGVGSAERGDVSIAATGMASTGDPMTLACDLYLLLVPSNSFSGRCDVTVGIDRLVITGLSANGGHAITAVLDGPVTLQGVAEEGTGPFIALVWDAFAGFTVHLRLDPLGRAWRIERVVPGSGTETVAGGRLNEGTVVFAIR